MVDSLLQISLLIAATYVLPIDAAKPSSCSTLPFSSATPSAAAGYSVQLIAEGLQDPRGIKFDSKGNLLVVESGKGITALTFDDEGGSCVSVESKKSLYASSPEAVQLWEYSPQTRANLTKPVILVDNMTNTDHTTRTLLLSKFAPGMLVVSRGSTSNIDPLASNENSGHAQVRAFNVSKMQNTPYNFPSDGLVLAWGVRNDVGIDENPITGGVYSVENSVDQMMRNGVDIHQTNPAEELNFLGYLNGTPSANQGRNFGYPQCYTAWDPSTIPEYQGVVGQQFAIGTLSKTNNDSMCSDKYRQQSRLGFHPHMAPLDILFNEEGSEAWITFHGSWDSDPPVGYKVSTLAFSGGEPVASSTSTDSIEDIVVNDVPISQCPEKCFRPVGLAWDKKQRLFFSSDQTGEIYMVMKNGGSTNAQSSGASPLSSQSRTVLYALALMQIIAILF